MSKRFGRNQKRKMREEIAKERRCAAYCRVQANEAKMLSRDARNALEEIARSLPAFTSMLPPKVIESIRPQLDVFRVPVTQPVAEVGAMRFASAFCSVVDLPIVKSALSIEPMSQMVHALVSYGDGRWGYAISERALLTKDSTDVIRTISEILALNMLSDLRSIKGAAR